MKNSSRIAASISIIDSFLSGEPIEKGLSNWARKSRYAGSSDRVAIRDIVFCCLRSLRSFSKIGNSLTGRGVVIGYLLAQNEDPMKYFTGTTYAPTKLSSVEIENILASAFGVFKSSYRALKTSSSGLQSSISISKS